MKDWLVTLLKAILPFVGACILGVLALLLYAWRSGSIVSRGFLLSLASKPLLITPGLGNWFLFLGYSTRFLKDKALQKAADIYYGLPAKNPRGQLIDPTTDRNALIAAIVREFESSKAILIVGKGGSGKTTLLRRITFLGLTNALPESLNEYRPVLVDVDDYEESPLKAVARSLQERGVLVDDKIIEGQLEAGKFLILFDTSDVSTDHKRKRLREIARSARREEYSNNRFLIACRQSEGIPDDLPVFELQPLTPSYISQLLAEFPFDSERNEAVRAQLKHFENDRLQPLLFSVILEPHSTVPTLAGIYERYFRLLLPENTDAYQLKGWHDAAGILAAWILLQTGQRGIGLSHDEIVTNLESNVLDRLRSLNRLSFGNGLEVLDAFVGMGILRRDDEWRFSDEKLGEYFAASYLVNFAKEHGSWPELKQWTELRERQEAFFGVLSFVREPPGQSPPAPLPSNIPSLWKRFLKREPLWPARVRFNGREYLHVPAGEFRMGTNAAVVDELFAKFGDQYLRREALTPEIPQHSVFVSDFYISRYPVTNEEYKAFVNDTNHRVPFQDDGFSRPYNWSPQYRTSPQGKEKYPVVMVSWRDTQAYCEWLGVRLPTEAEWEKAARGIDGRAWPWGDWQDGRCNCGGSLDLVQVGQFSPDGDSPYGVSDMAGNVFEWCNSLYRSYPYRVEDGRENMQADGSRVVRGGAAGPSILKTRCAFRQGNNPDDYGFSIGFRVVLTDQALSKAEVI